MEIEEVMAPVVDDMETTVRRFAGRIELWKKFLLKFKDDLTYAELQTAYELSDGPAMERAVHTMKGIAANLGLQRLSDASADMVRSVRENRPDLFEKNMEAVRREYQAVLDAIRKFAD